MPQNHEGTKLHEILKSILFHFGETLCFSDFVAKRLVGVVSKINQ